MAPEFEAFPLEWIDEYVDRIREYIFVREADNLLLKVPNEAFRLNDSGIRILKRLLNGESVISLWDSYGRSNEVRRDLYHFFVSLKQILQGCVNERNFPAAIDARPFSLGFNTLPVLSEVAVTYRCNLKCRFCYAGCSCSTGSGAEADLPTHDIREILRIIKEDAQVPSVSFTGGEPLMRRDLPELIRFARNELGMRVNLISNGTRIDEQMARTLKESGLNSAQISLESPDPSIHDRLTQTPRSHAKTCRAVGHLLDQNIIVHTNTTINRFNMESALQMPEFVKTLGLERFSMNLVIPSGSSLTTHQDVNVRYSEVSDLILRIRDESARHSVEFMWYSPTPVCIFNPVQHRLGNKSCAACDGLLSVSPQGNILPCSSWPEPVGNILSDGFEAVWNSVQACWLREKEFAAPLCRDCEEFALCQGACPLYWRYFGHEELDRFGVPYVASFASTC